MFESCVKNEQNKLILYFFQNLTFHELEKIIDGLHIKLAIYKCILKLYLKKKYIYKNKFYAFLFARFFMILNLKLTLNFTHQGNFFVKIGATFLPEKKKGKYV